MKQALRIKEACWQKGVKVKDLADVLGITASSMSTAIAHDRFTAKDLIAIADALDVPVSELFTDRQEFSAEVKVNGSTFRFSSREDLARWLSLGNDNCAGELHNLPNRE